MTSVTPLEPTAIDGHAPTSTGNEKHPMRAVTRRAAGLVPGGWDAETRRTVAALFDGLAPDWHTRDSPQRRAVVSDCLERGLDATAWPGGTDTVGIELGSGTGIYSDLVAGVVGSAVAVDLSDAMLREAPSAPAARLRGDSSALPLRSGAADLAAVINMFLFPGEIARVLRPGGILLWVNVSGPDTPIHLSTDEVVAALPFEVEGVESTAGAGTWCALRRIR